MRTADLFIFALSLAPETNSMKRRRHTLAAMDMNLMDSWTAARKAMDCPQQPIWSRFTTQLDPTYAVAVIQFKLPLPQCLWLCFTVSDVRTHQLGHQKVLLPEQQRWYPCNILYGNQILILVPPVETHVKCLSFHLKHLQSLFWSNIFLGHYSISLSCMWMCRCVLVCMQNQTKCGLTCTYLWFKTPLGSFNLHFF